MQLKGRKKLVSNYKSKDLINDNILVDVLNQARLEHNSNKSEIEYLINYKKGIQPILEKNKTVREEINNKVVINHAQMTTRNIIGYFLGNPIQYVQDGDSDKKELIDELNRVVRYEDKDSIDKELGEYQSITGTAFRIIYKDGEFEDEVPFEDRSLDPRTTFVVYENDISERPLFGATFYNIYDGDKNYIGTKYYVYTSFGRYEIMTDDTGVVQRESIVDFKEYDVGGVPIIEYPNNMWRIGDWELMIGLMDAINNLHSGRFDDIDQIIQSLLVFINADLDGEQYAEMRREGIVLLKSIGGERGTNSKVEVINNPLDQAGMNLFAQELEELLYALLGIPSRNNRSGGGGDTGQAVELRDGWADLEIIARNKELTFKKSEKRTLKIILNIFNIGREEKLNLVDIDIKFSRNKSNNLLVKTQSYQTLISTKTLDPADCLSIVDLVSDVNEFIDRGKAFWGSEFAQSNSRNGNNNYEDVDIDNNMSIIDE